MAVKRAGNPKFRKGFDSLGRNTWLSKSSHSNSSAHLRSGVAHIAEQESEALKAERFAQRQSGLVRRRIAEVLGVDADVRFTQDSYLEGPRGAAPDEVTSQQIQGDITVATPRGDLVVGFHTGRSKKKRGLLASNPPWVFLTYDNKPFSRIRDLQAMLSDDMCEGLAELSPRPTRAKRDHRKDRRLLRKGRKYVELHAPQVEVVAGERLGVGVEDVRLFAEMYSEQQTEVRGRWRPRRAIEGEATLVTPDGSVRVDVDVVEVRRKTEFGTANDYTDIVFMYNGKELWSPQEVARIAKKQNQ